MPTKVCNEDVQQAGISDFLSFALFVDYKAALCEWQMQKKSV